MRRKKKRQLEVSIPSTVPPKVLRSADAAAYCGSSESTFCKLRIYGGGPDFIKLGRRVVYRISDLDDWIKKNRVTA